METFLVWGLPLLYAIAGSLIYFRVRDASQRTPLDRLSEQASAIGFILQDEDSIAVQSFIESLNLDKFHSNCAVRHLMVGERDSVSIAVFELCQDVLAADPEWQTVIQMDGGTHLPEMVIRPKTSPILFTSHVSAPMQSTEEDDFATTYRYHYESGFFRELSAELKAYFCASNQLSVERLEDLLYCYRYNTLIFSFEIDAAVRQMIQLQTELAANFVPEPVKVQISAPQ